MWADRYASVCARHADLIAVHESPRGSLALVLRQTLVPLAEERAAWLGDTRRITRQIVGDLGAAGFASGVLVVQWLPLEEAARILAAWPCRYVGDTGRQAALARLLDRYLADRRFVASHVAGSSTPDLIGEDSFAYLALLGDARQALAHWYRAMTPRWLAIEPALRRRLVLETHRWIVAQLLGTDGAAVAPAVDLTPEGKFERTLAQFVPRDALAQWRPWIRRVLADLGCAFACPAADRTEAWARWLFLVAYSVPGPRGPSPSPVSAVVRSAGVGRAPDEGAGRPEHHGADRHVLERSADVVSIPLAHRGAPGRAAAPAPRLRRGHRGAGDRVGL